ncbi:MAG: SEC-C metal-binding domain-containing protein [Lachnospiraceae bacterium]|nr:SEC-C metal-binding domain-containing protein [Lachnospiraceae bacterium]MDY5742527.1 SEC-C metal-binding domain-containing protein [Lachnospiraceae bacterium]
MGLYEQWQELAYNKEQDRNELEKFWQEYFLLEKGIYESLLAAPDVEVRGTVAELAKKYDVELLTMVGFLDGINESLKQANALEEDLTEDTEVNLVFDKETLYKNMVDARAEWLYELPAWDDIFEADHKRALYREAKQMGVIKKAPKIGRNDQCPCGSGKKYKHCCGR